MPSPRATNGTRGFGVTPAGGIGGVFLPPRVDTGKKRGKADNPMMLNFEKDAESGGFRLPNLGFVTTDNGVSGLKGPLLVDGTDAKQMHRVEQLGQISQEEDWRNVNKAKREDFCGQLYLGQERGDFEATRVYSPAVDIDYANFDKEIVCFDSHGHKTRTKRVCLVADTVTDRTGIESTDPWHIPAMEMR